MKNGKKIFILVETFLGLMVFVLVMFMFLEKNEKKQEKISVIIQNSDDSQWAAFKYGAKESGGTSAKQTEEKICPRCGLALKKRNGRFGGFWGCTGFPDCRYTKNV